MAREKIVVMVDKDDVFFHVFGDQRKYYDLGSLSLHHPELDNYVEGNRYSLNRTFYQKREILGLV